MRSASAQWLRSEPENCRSAVDNVGKSADELDPDPGQCVEVEDVALTRADELQRGDAPRAHDVVDLVVTLIEGRPSRPSTTGYRGRDRFEAPRTCSPTAMVTSDQLRPSPEMSSSAGAFG